MFRKGNSVSFVFLSLFLFVIYSSSYAEELKIGDRVTITGTVIVDELDEKGNVLEICLSTKNGLYRVVGKDNVKKLETAIDRIVTVTGNIDVDENGNRTIFVKKITILE